MVVHIHTFLQKVRRTLKSERGEANYFSTVVFIFIAVILLAFIIDLFGIISTKQELDHAADQMVKQIQLSGGINSEANYFSTVVFIFIAVILLAFIIDLFGIISTKQELDHAADQMVKQIQLSGGINSETDSLFDFLCSEIEGAENITYSIDATYKTPTPSGMSRAIQLGTPFYITIEGEAKLGGFWNLDLVNITVVARGSGVSEHYWK